jgi:hypothetical protein
MVADSGVMGAEKQKMSQHLIKYWFLLTYKTIIRYNVVTLEDNSE